MTREELLVQIENYIPWNEQEACDREVILEQLRSRPDIFDRSCLTCHMTASAWVTNADHSRILMAYHNLYDSWSWLGGHADGDTDLPAVALREVEEESGIHSLRILSDGIFSLEVLTVDGHLKRGHYVPSHLHLNLTWLVEADEREALRIKADENSAVAWFTPEEAVSSSSEPWFREHIYSKLNEKMRALTEKSTDNTYEESIISESPAGAGLL